MPDYNKRTRLKKKMLDRWENEGGRTAAEPVRANQSNPASKCDDEDSQAPASVDRSTVATPLSRAKRRKIIQK
jgi:hypothetical protein